MTSLPPAGPVVRIDPLAMQRILANLVDNAVRYGERARLSVHEHQGRIEIRVETTDRSRLRSGPQGPDARSAGSTIRVRATPAGPGSGSRSSMPWPSNMAGR